MKTKRKYIIFLSALLLMMVISTFILPVHASDTLVDYNATFNTNTNITSLDPTVIYSNFGQSFNDTLPGGYNLTSCKWDLSKTGSPTVNLTCCLYAHTGTYGLSSKGTGQALATSTPINSSTLTGLFVWTEFFFPEPRYTLISGVKYVLLITAWNTTGTISGSICINVKFQGSDVHAGNYLYYNAGAWTVLNSRDFAFYVYGLSNNVYATFAYSDVAQLIVNGTAYGNASVLFNRGDTMYLVMAVEANYTFYNWTYDGSSSIDNPFNLGITENITVTGYVGELSGGTGTIITVTETYIHPIVYVAIGIAVISFCLLGVEEKKRRH